MDELTIRPVVASDAVAYRNLRLHLLRVSPDSYGTTYEEAIARPLSATVARLREHGDPEVGFTLGAFTPDLVGMVTVLRDEGAKTRHKAHVFSMGVAASARGRGIGRALMVEAIARARQLAGLEQLLLTVVLPNEAAQRLYHGLGFVTFGIERRGLKLGDQYWDEDQMILEL